MEPVDVQQAHVPHVFEAPQLAVVAKVYAQSLLNLVPQEGWDDILNELEEFITGVLKGPSAFRAVLLSGMSGRDEKQRLLEKVLRGRMNDLLVNVLSVMARNERLNLIEPMLREARKLVEAKAGRKRVRVISAVPLSEAQLQSVRETVGRLVQGEPVLEPSVDPRLMGGLQIRVDDTLYDGSLRSRLVQLRHQLRQRSMHEIQSGRDRFGS